MIVFGAEASQWTTGVPSGKSAILSMADNDRWNAATTKLSYAIELARQIRRNSVPSYS